MDTKRNTLLYPYKQSVFDSKKHFNPLTYFEINNYLYDNLIINLSSIFILATILLWELLGYIEKQSIWIWYSLVLIILVFRVITLLWFRKTKKNIKYQRYHYIVFVTGSCLSAIMWGILGSLLMPAEIYHQTFILIMISGILAGSTIGLGARYLTSILYIYLSLIPIIIWEGVQVLDGRQFYLGIFISMVLYLFYSSITAFKISKIIHKNIILKNHNFVLLEQLNQYVLQIELFSEMGEALEKCRSRQEIGVVCKSFISRIFPETSNRIFLFSKYNDRLEYVKEWSDSIAKNQQTILSENDCLAVKTKGLHISYDADRCKHCSNPSQLCACLPLKTSLEFFGILHIESKSKTTSQEKQFFLSQKDLYTRVAAIISSALSTIEYQNLLEAQATEDKLTGLYNRRYLDNYFNIELAKFGRKSSPISIIMIDIDFFKKFNDQYGHQVGDKVLYELSLLLKRSVRGSDFACRYGGEEFILILPDSNKEAAYERAERIRKQVKALSITIDNKQIQGITISLGVSVFPENGETQALIIKAADEALYRAKKEGRDRVCIASSNES